MSQHPTTAPGRATRATRPGGPAFISPEFTDPASADADPDLVPTLGRHALWCASADVPEGAPVSEHAACESRGFPADAWGAQQQPRTVWASLVQPYRHGAYQRADVYGRPTRPFVSLIWEEDDPQAARAFGAFLSPAEARTLAAALVRLANTAEGHDLPMTRRGGEAR